MIKIVRSSSTNAEVTDYYLDVIASLMEACGEKKYEDDVDLGNSVKWRTLLLLLRLLILLNYILRDKNQIYWMQGIDAEEKSI